MKIRKSIFVFLVAMMLAGCTTPVRYIPEHFPVSLPSGFQQIHGRGFIYTETPRDAYIFEGYPTSFTGCGLKLEIPLGQIVREAALTAFTKVFTDGAVAGNKLPKTKEYCAIVEPRVQYFEHQYNQLRNLGFAVTPEVRLTLYVKFIATDGRTLYEKTYDSGMTDGRTYLMCFTPEERINEIAHKTLFALMLIAAEDIRIAVAKGRHENVTLANQTPTGVQATGNPAMSAGDTKTPVLKPVGLHPLDDLLR